MEKLETTHILSLFNSKMPLFASFRLFSLSRPTGVFGLPVVKEYFLHYPMGEGGGI